MRQAKCLVSKILLSGKCVSVCVCACVRVCVCMYVCPCPQAMKNLNNQSNKSYCFSISLVIMLMGRGLSNEVCREFLTKKTMLHTCMCYTDKEDYVTYVHVLY